MSSSCLFMMLVDLLPDLSYVWRCSQEDFHTELTSVTMVSLSSSTAPMFLAEGTAWTGISNTDEWHIWNQVRVRRTNDKEFSLAAIKFMIVTCCSWLHFINTLLQLCTLPHHAPHQPPRKVVCHLCTDETWHSECLYAILPIREEYLEKLEVLTTKPWGIPYRSLCSLEVMPYILTG